MFLYFAVVLGIGVMARRQVSDSVDFFLSGGDRIWAWLVRLAPRASREHIDSSGRVAWVSLTQFVRATVLVAAADAIGIMIVAAFLQVPFVVAIGVLVFLGAFVPMIGATVAGLVAILVALVDQGPLTALLMLAGQDRIVNNAMTVNGAFEDGFLRVWPRQFLIAFAVMCSGITSASTDSPPSIKYKLACET